MDIPVLLEPTQTGWRATTGALLNLVAQGTALGFAVRVRKILVEVALTAAATAFTRGAKVAKMPGE